MKKTIKLGGLGLFMAFGLLSCEPAEDDIRENPREIGGYAYLRDRSISSFDQNENLEINLFTADGIEVEDVEVVQNGAVLGNATISGETASFNASILGDLSAGEEFPIKIRSTLSNGKIAEDQFTIVVENAITLDDVPSSVRFLDTTSNVFTYSTFADHAEIEQVSLFFRSNLQKEYSLIADDLDVAEGEIDLGEFDYKEYGLAAGDTIYYRFVAESGEFSEEAVTSIPIVSQEFNGSTTASLSEDEAGDSFTLESGEHIEDAEAEILFMSPLGFRTQKGLNFVHAAVPDSMTSTEFFAGTDLFEAETIYMNSTPVTSVENVEEGDVFVYRVVRQNDSNEDIEYYGMIKVGDVTVTNATEESFDFTYTEGTIIRE